MQGELLGGQQHKNQNPGIVYIRDHPPAVNMQTKVIKSKTEICIAFD